MLYVNFAMSHYPSASESSTLMCLFTSFFTLSALTHELLNCRPTLSYQRLRTEQPLSDEELYTKIRRTVPNKHDSQVLESFLVFNKYVSQTVLF